MSDGTIAKGTVVASRFMREDSHPPAVATMIHIDSGGRHCGHKRRSDLPSDRPWPALLVMSVCGDILKYGVPERLSETAESRASDMRCNQENHFAEVVVHSGPLDLGPV